MDKISTRFLTYSEIDVANADLYEDIFFNSSDIVLARTLLGLFEREPSPGVVKRILDIS